LALSVRQVGRPLPVADDDRDELRSELVVLD